MKVLFVTFCVVLGLMATSCDDDETEGEKGPCVPCCECKCCGKEVTVRPTSNASCGSCADNCAAFCEPAYKCSTVDSAEPCVEDAGVQDAATDV